MPAAVKHEPSVSCIHIHKLGQIAPRQVYKNTCGVCMSICVHRGIRMRGKCFKAGAQHAVLICDSG